MKSIATVAGLLLAASLMQAQSQPVAQPTTPATEQPVVVKPANPKPAPGKPAPAKPTAPAKKVEPAPLKIPGIEIKRDNGTLLGLEVVDNQFKLSFYSAKRKPMAVDVTRATARWPNLHDDTGDNRTVLNPSGSALVGAKPVLPPYTFNVFITLLAGDGDQAEAVESYAVPFHD